MNYLVKKLLKTILPEKIKNYIRMTREESQINNRHRRRKNLQVQVHLVEHCNLNCKYCAHFSPCAEEEYIDIARFEQDIKRLSELTNARLEKLVLMGGEPLLHPELTALFDISRCYFPKSPITCNTNGILLEKQGDVFWDNCNINNIEIIITKYPIKINMEVLSAKAAKHNVILRYFDETIKDMWKVPLNINGKDADYNFSRCPQANWCISLQNGKLFTCGTIPYIRHFNKYFNYYFEVTDNDFIDIFTVKSLNEILDFLSRPAPFCRYCDQRAIIRHLEWGISKREISEWV
jgi:MoaA/NifB/PqqE/SkfB family radical SAM enzyme